MAIERFDTKSASEAVAVLFDQALPDLPVITNEDIRRICRESLKYNIDTGDRHVVASADHLRPIVSWNLERVPQQLPAGQRVIGYQVNVQPELQFAVLSIVVGDTQGSPGYMFGIRFWMTSDGLFVQGYEGFRTLPPNLPTSAGKRAEIEVREEKEERKTKKKNRKLGTVEDISDKHLMAKGNSIEETRAIIMEQIPYGMSVISEKVVCDGKPQVLHGEGDSVAIAFQDALSKKSTDAEVIEQRTLSESQIKKISIEAFDEADAMRQALTERDLKAGGKVASILMRSKGRTGFLGMGRKPHTYEVEIRKPARVEITVKPQVVVKATVGLSRIQKAVSIVPRFASALDALVPQKISNAEKQYTKLEIIGTFLFALVQQDIGWRSYEIYGIKQHERPVSRVRWSSSSKAVKIKHHTDYADGSQMDWTNEIVRLPEGTFFFRGEYGILSIANIYGMLSTAGSSSGDSPKDFLRRAGIRDVLKEAFRRGIVDS